MLHRTTKENAPRRKRERASSPLDDHTDFQELKAAALSGALKAGEMAWIELDPKTVKRLRSEMKDPARVMVDTLRRALLAAGMADLKAIKYCSASDRWIVGVRRADKRAEEGSDHQQREGAA